MKRVSIFCYLFVALLVNSLEAKTRTYSYYSKSSCRREVSINKANVHTIVSMICTLHAANLKERDHLQKHYGSDYIHHWEITDKATSIDVDGVCSNKVDFVEGKKLLPGEKLKISFDKKFKRDKTFSGKLGVRKTSVSFRYHSHDDESCDEGFVMRSLDNIVVGEFSVSGLFGMGFSKHSHATIRNPSRENWDQAKGLGFNAIDVEYDVHSNLYPGTAAKVSLMATGRSPRRLHLKYVNYIEKNVMQVKNMQSDFPKANNIFFADRSFNTIRGCSHLVFPGQTETPEYYSDNRCKSSIKYFDDEIPRLNFAGPFTFPADLSPKKEVKSENDIYKDLVKDLITELKQEFQCNRRYCDYNVAKDNCIPWFDNTMDYAEKLCIQSTGQYDFENKTADVFFIFKYKSGQLERQTMNFAWDSSSNQFVLLN